MIHRRDQGFTLLEVVVAFIIASIAVVVLYGSAAGGVLAAREAARMDEALARAQSRMTAICQGGTIQPGTHVGDDGHGFRWHTEVAVAAEGPVARAEPVPPPRATLYALRVTLSWPGPARTHSVSLETRCATVGRGPVQSG